MLCVLIYLLESVLCVVRSLPLSDGYCTARVRGIHLLIVAAHPFFCSIRSFSKITVATGDDGANAGSAADIGNATGLTLSDDVD